MSESPSAPTGSIEAGDLPSGPPSEGPTEADHAQPGQARPPVDPKGARSTHSEPLEVKLPSSAIAIVSAYIAAQMLADISSVKIGIVAGLAVDMGTFVYPFTFTLRDSVHKVLGKSSARLLIVTAAVINVVMALYLWWVAGVPGDPDWGLSAEFAAVLAPVGRIVVASIVAEVISELIDTEVYHWFVTRITTRHQWMRVVVSNGISIPIDSLVFSVLAFAPLPGFATGLPWSVVWQIFLFNVGLKYAVTVVSVPLIYVVPDRDWASPDR